MKPQPAHHLQQPRAGVRARRPDRLRVRPAARRRGAPLPAARRIRELAHQQRPVAPRAGVGRAHPAHPRAVGGVLALDRQRRPSGLHQVGPPAARPAGRRGSRRLGRARLVHLRRRERGRDAFGAHRRRDLPRGALRRRSVGAAERAAAPVQPLHAVGDQPRRHRRGDPQPRRPARARRDLLRGQLRRRHQPHATPGRFSPPTRASSALPARG